MAWLLDWAKRVKLTIDQNDIDAALANFPVLIHLGISVGHSSDDVSFVFDELESNANRKKIAVTTADGQTQCYVEIEKWVDADEEAWLWVKVPSVASGADTDLYLYYDKTKADNTGYVGDPSDAVVHNVWDSNFKLVTHMRDDPDASHIKDSTVNANDGTKVGPTETGGLIDGAQDFDGNDYIDVPADNLNITDAITFEALIKLDILPTSTTRHFVFLSKDGVYWLFIGVGNDKVYLHITGESGSYESSGISVLDTDKFYHLVGSYRASDGQFRIYVNGVLEGDTTKDIGNILVNLNPVKIGTLWSNFFEGIIDELRISDIARTTAWIKASYESERDHLLDFGSEETGNIENISENKSANMAAKMVAAGLI